MASIKENQLHFQKKTFNYSEANQEKREKYLEEILTIDPKNIVYSDEAGIDDNEVTPTGWSEKGERCFSEKSAVRSTRYNIIAALNMNLLFAPLIFEGYANALVYETYVERVLVPSLVAGMVVVIDNARFHKSKRIIDLIEAAGCRIIFLPPYSPDLNPIEHYWSATKHKIRTVARETNNFYNAVVKVMNEMCTA